MIAAMSVVALVVAGTFIGFHLRTEKLTIGLVHQQAEALFRQVVLTRRWVTRHGGVFVRVQPGVNPNPYLTSIPGMKVTIRDEDGELYTLRNPGLMTREISQLANESGLYTVRITSLKPINVGTNTPDDFEHAALLRLEQGETSVSAIQETARGPIYRYIAPLYYEDSCNEIALNRLYTIAAAILVFVLLFVLLALLSRRFVKALGTAQEELVRSASTDSLTGLMNRRTALARFDEEISRHERNGAPLSCLLIDLDNFKSVNDTLGHQAGDRAIEFVSKLMGCHVRKHDILCRYGGEEFMVLLTDTRLPAAMMVAEKLREAVALGQLELSGKRVVITISCGVAEREQGECVDALIGRADAALYRAKAEGRNCVCASAHSVPMEHHS
jgi:diguanylate cyclase (GGDEF)-like protein